MSFKNSESKSKSMKKNVKEPTNLNELIIQEAVKQYKSGNISCGLDVENFLDGLLQPLMQTLLDSYFFVCAIFQDFISLYYHFECLIFIRFSIF